MVINQGHTPGYFTLFSLVLFHLGDSESIYQVMLITEVFALKFMEKRNMEKKKHLALVHFASLGVHLYSRLP